MHRYFRSFLLQLLLNISINWLSHPTAFNPALSSSQFQAMGLKRKLLLHAGWSVSATHRKCSVLSSKQLLFFSVTHQILDHHVKFPLMPLSPEVVNPGRLLLITGGAPACIDHQSVSFILSTWSSQFFTRIVKAMWAEQKKNRPWRWKSLPFDTWCCFPD